MEKEYSRKYLQLNRDKTIVYEANRMPFYSVRPELTDLTENQMLREKFSSQFPNLTFDQASIIDGAVIIQDLMTPKNEKPENLLQKVKQLNYDSAITLQILDGKKTTEQLVSLLREQYQGDEYPTIILPGNGALSVANQIETIDPSLLSNAYSVFVKRTLIKPGTFEITINENEIPNETESNRYLIIDDVVASGQTANALATAIFTRNPQARIDLATWLYLWPNEKSNLTSPSGIDKINRVTTAIAAKGNYVSRPPINSLSCFLATDPQSVEKVSLYKEKYIRDKDSFTTQLTNLKGVYK